MRFLIFFSLLFLYSDLVADESKNKEIDQIFDKMCSCHVMEGYYMDSINSEKQKESIGGYVDKKAVYSYSEKVLMARNAIKALNEKLIRLEAPKSDLSKCPSINNINVKVKKVGECMRAVFNMAKESLRK